MKLKQQYLTALALSVAMCAPLATNASSFSFDPTGGNGGPTISNISLIDEAPGNAYAAGGITAINNFLAHQANPNANGSTLFDLYYQANLGTLQNNGVPVFSQGTGGRYFTFVAGFSETVTTAIAAPGIGFAAFNLNTAPGALNYFKIYANTGGNDQTGKGFVDGAAILSGHIVNESISSFTVTGPEGYLRQDGVPLVNTGAGTLKNQRSLVGAGSTIISVQVDNFLPSYFPNFDITQPLTSTFTTGAAIPFSSIFPAECINTQSGNCMAAGGITTNGTLGPVNGAFGSNATGFLFAADANSTLNGTVIPEPSSIAILGLGLVALGFAGLSRKKQ